jgi:pilus assembly protein CpaC
LRTDRWLSLLALLLTVSGLVAVRPAGAQPLPNLPEGEPIPVIDGRNADLVGSIVDTDYNRIFEDRIAKGILRPNYGIEDLFLTKKSSAILELESLGPSCLQATKGDVVTSTDPPRDPKKSVRNRKINAGEKNDTTMILVTQRAPGDEKCEKLGTSLLKVFRVTVTDEDLINLLQELKALIGQTEGLQMRIVGQQVILDGQIILAREFRRLLTVLEKYKDKPIINLLELSPLAAQLTSEKMEEAIAGGPDRPRDIKVRVVNGRFFLEGSVDKRAQRDEAVRICQAFVTENYELLPNGIQVPRFDGLRECNSSVWIRQGQPKEPDAIISVRADFVTLAREYLKNFSFSWKPSVGASADVSYTSDVGKFASSFVATLSNLFPKLDTAAKHGYARVLKTATLMVQDKTSGNPDPATITENLNIPFFFDDTDQNGNRVTRSSSVDVSTELKVTVQSVLGSDKINMSVQAKQEELKGSGAAGQSPRVTNTVDTRFTVTNGESAALAGIVTERRNVNFIRDPADAGGGTSNFNLFNVSRSHNFSDDKGQFIIFITPTKMRNPEQGTEELKRKFRLRR